MYIQLLTVVRFSTKMSDSPARARTLSSFKSTPRKGKSQANLHQPQKAIYSFDADMTTADEYEEEEEPYSATISELMPRRQQDSSLFSSSTLAHRRQQHPPSPLKMASVGHATRSKSIPRRPQFEAISATVSPLSPYRHRRMKSEPREPTPRFAERISPLEEPSSGTNHPQGVSRVSATSSKYSFDEHHVKDGMLNAYSKWNEEDRGYTTPAVDPTPTMPPAIPARTARPRQPISIPGNMRPPHPVDAQQVFDQAQQYIHGGNPQRLQSPIKFRDDADMPPSTPFSPFPYYFRGEGQVTKVGEKKLIGENGWLERTNPPDEGKDKKKSPQKKTGFLDSIKRIAKDMVSSNSSIGGGFFPVDDVPADFFPQVDEHLASGPPPPIGVTSYRPMSWRRWNVNTEVEFLTDLMKKAELSTRSSASSSTTAPRPPQIQISLSAREQSLLYCELEYHLNTILNTYISKQLHLGLLSPTHLARIADRWASLGRPRVIAFRYDLETQVDLIILHLREFQFYGRRQGSTVEIGGVLESVKRNARQMRSRTFCSPDSVVAKQLVDAQNLCEVVGVEGEEGRPVLEIVQFFRVCVEREVMTKKNKEKEEEMARNNAHTHVHTHAHESGDGDHEMIDGDHDMQN